MQEWKEQDSDVLENQGRGIFSECSHRAPSTVVIANTSPDSGKPAGKISASCHPPPTTTTNEYSLVRYLAPCWACVADETFLS